MSEPKSPEVERLWRLYRARRGISGYKANVEEIVRQLRDAGETVDDYE